MLALILAAALAAPHAERCPVTGLPVGNPRLYHTVTLRGRTYRVFDRNAAARLRACPSCYLAPDGTPLNATPGAPA